ncbi:hypothetical protein KI387_031988, partial [Taxus chinensis]
RTDIAALVESSVKSKDMPLPEKSSNSMYLVLTSEDVTVEGFYMSSCGFHANILPSPANGGKLLPYAWVGNSVSQFPAGVVTNPFNTGYFQGDASASLEAVSACTGIYGKGAYLGYTGELLVDATTGASFNVHGVNGRRYLLPTMWDPTTKSCKTDINVHRRPRMAYGTEKIQTKNQNIKGVSKHLQKQK